MEKQLNDSEKAPQLFMNNIFHPRSVAVIGASSDSDRESRVGWVGRLVKFGYKGQIYPINPKATEILGYKAYPKLSDVPGPIDYAIISVPRAFTLQSVKDCVAKGVKTVHCFTAGFAETGKPEGEELQNQLAEAIKGSDTRVIGPNCMGVYSPSGGLTFDIRFPTEVGSIAFISQSGAGGRRLISLATSRGLRFRNAVSFGNALDLSTNDFLEYAIADPETKYVLLYVEGIKDGHRFFELLRECTKKKPVVLLKAGLSESGAGAVASHTASLAGSKSVWKALFRQTGAIQVETFEEAVEQLIAVQDIKPIHGRRIAIVGRGGGIGVVTTDLCEKEGLKVPAFTAETKEKLAPLTTADAGSSIRNPVEIGLGVDGVSKHYIEGLKAVAADPNIDSILSFLSPGEYIHYGITGWIEGISKALGEAGQVLSKPFAAVVLPGQDTAVFEANLAIQHQCHAAGIACFPSLDVGIKAIGKLTKYYELQESRLSEEGN